MTSYVSPQPFDNFLESLASATYDEFRSLPGSEVESGSAFEEMRKYLRDLYKDVRVVASFVEDSGQVVDCIPVDQHPAVKRYGETIPTTAPAAQPAPESYETTPPSFISPSTKEISDALPRTRDQEGADVRTKYPPGTIPMYRATLEQLSRFRNLSEFCAKGSVEDFAAPGGSS